MWGPRVRAYWYIAATARDVGRGPIARTVLGEPLVLFRDPDRRPVALLDRCPHKGGPLSQGIVFGRSVACPLHGWIIRLEDGCAEAPDTGCTRSFPVKIENGEVLLQLPD